MPSEALAKEGCFKALRSSCSALIPIQLSNSLAHLVIAGLDPAIHLLRKMFLRRSMDARVKPGHDECF
jgi:hypothetical protein